MANFDANDMRGIDAVGQWMVKVKTGQATIAEARAFAQALLDAPTTSPVMRAQARAMLAVLAKWEAGQ